MQAGLGYEMTDGRDMKEIIGQGEIWECENTAVRVGGRHGIISHMEPEGRLGISEIGAC